MMDQQASWRIRVFNTAEDDSGSSSEDLFSSESWRSFLDYPLAVSFSHEGPIEQAFGIKNEGVWVKSLCPHRKYEAG